MPHKLLVCITTVHATFVLIWSECLYHQYYNAIHTLLDVKCRWRKYHRCFCLSLILLIAVTLLKRRTTSYNFGCCWIWDGGTKNVWIIIIWIHAFFILRMPNNNEFGRNEHRLINVHDEKCQCHLHRRINRHHGTCVCVSRETRCDIPGKIAPVPFHFIFFHFLLSVIHCVSPNHQHPQNITQFAY